LAPTSLGQRYFPHVQEMFSKGHTAMESFPSADTIGGSVFSATLYKMSLLSGGPALVLSMLIAYSRLYLQAHHLTDVLVGMCLGWTVTLVMWDAFGADRLLDASHAVAGTLFFVVFALVARKFKRSLPTHMLRKKSMMGF
jgi:membrane-associated phospholipid phosphatase